MNRIVGALIMLIGTVTVIVATPSAAAAAAGVLVVNTTADEADTNLSDGVCRAASGDCTLRAAIATANVRPGDDRIEFNIPGDGTKTIRINQPLPDVYDPTGRLTIDGYTQGDATPNNAATGSNARIRVQIFGPSDNSVEYGIRLTSAENTVRGLAISGFYRNLAIHFEQADGNVVAGNFIGLRANGNQYQDRGRTGVHIWLGPDFNQVGGPNLADRNVISGNTANGVLIEQGNTSRNTVRNNVIGLTPSLGGALPQVAGIDVQWGTWGNVIGSPDRALGNLIGGNRSGGIDLSHSSVGSLVLNNLIGTLGDGNSAASHTGNGKGILIKDNSIDNHIEGNVIANNTSDGVWQRHNYSGPSVWVNNRIGVGVNGAALPNGGLGIQVNGHDDIFHSNIVANNTQGGILIIDEWVANQHTNFPAEHTLRNAIRQNTLYRNGGGPAIDIGPNGHNTAGPHRRLASAEVTGLGAGEVYGRACAGCDVEIFISGRVRNDGTINVGSNNNGTGAGYIGRAVAGGNGRFSLQAAEIKVGKRISFVVIDGANNTSELSSAVVPGQPFGIRGNPAASLAPVAAPARPDLPPPYVSQLPGEFTCSQADGTLSWSDADADAYYVFAVTNGVEQYLGGHSATSLVVPNADSYRVEHWKFGGATNATCDFTSGGAAFSCSVEGGTLSWGDAGAQEYYVFSTSGGTERYLGGHSGTSLNVQSADSYRVEHWQGNGPTNANCEGGGAVVFSCSVDGGTLSWTDVGAVEYYVFATTGGTERYLGGHAATSLAVTAADSYRIEHWITGNVTNATCS